MGEMTMGSATPARAEGRFSHFDYSAVPHAAQAGAGGVNYFGRRVEHIFARNADRIRGRKVLDLACFTGVLSWPLLQLGAESVAGVEARAESIERGRALFAGSAFERRMSFHQADLFDYLARAGRGQFDIIVCAGFLYHTVRHADFFREMKRLAPETLFIDTNVAKNYWWFGRRNFGQPPALFMYTEDAALARNTLDPDGVVYWPTTSFIEAMARGAGFEPARIDFHRRHNGDWTRMEDYRRGLRAAWMCARK